MASERPFIQAVRLTLEMAKDREVSRENRGLWREWSQLKDSLDTEEADLLNELNEALERS